VRDTFTYSETLIGLAPIYWALRGFMDEALAAQWWILIITGLNYGACALVLRWFGVTVPLTIAGAYVFAFGLVRTDHLTHQQLLPHVFAPFAVWYAWRLVQEPTVRRWTLLLGLIAGQIFASLHLGWFLWFGFVVFFSLVLAFAPETRQRLVRFVREQWWRLLIPTALVALAVGAYAYPFYRGTPERRDYGNVIPYAPLIDCWFVAVNDNFWKDHLSPRTDSYDEARLFHGLTAYLVMGIAWWNARRYQRLQLFTYLFLGTAGFLALAVTLFPGNTSLWFVIHTLVPGANAFRAIGRIVLTALLFGGIGGLVGFDDWLRQRRWRPGVRTGVAVLVMLAMIAEQTYYPRESFAKHEHCYGPAREMAELLRGADAGYVVYTDALPDYRHHITAMWAGLYAGVPMMNGFSGTSPKDYPAYAMQPSLEWLMELLGPEWHGTFVVIDWGPPKRRFVYQVRPGTDHAQRYTRRDEGG
jgi:hypothetical protein